MIHSRISVIGVVICFTMQRAATSTPRDRHDFRPFVTSANRASSFRFTSPRNSSPTRPVSDCWPIWRRPRFRKRGTRYAILYSGMSNKRHLNDMEFLYRTLIDVYGFDASHIQVLTYDGSLNTQDGVQTRWPGDGTAYRIQVNGQGNRAAFEGAVDSLKAKLKSDDTILIHCNNHGIMTEFGYFVPLHVPELGPVL